MCTLRSDIYTARRQKISRREWKSVYTWAISKRKSFPFGRFVRFFDVFSYEWRRTNDGTACISPFRDDFFAAKTSPGSISPVLTVVYSSNVETSWRFGIEIKKKKERVRFIIPFVSPAPELIASCLGQITFRTRYYIYKIRRRDRTGRPYRRRYITRYLRAS